MQNEALACPLCLRLTEWGSASTPAPTMAQKMCIDAVKRFPAGS